MDERPINNAPEPPHHGHHVSARERQRRGPMWGCLKGIIIGSIAAFILLIIVIGGGWLYLGSASFADLVRLRIQKTLESRLGRAVSIGSVKIVTSRPQRVIINDLRIANSPGTVNKYFATVRQLEITGGVESFWGRDIHVSRVDIRDPRMNVEIYPAGSPLVHNFPHWNAGPKSRYEMVHMTIGRMFVTGGAMNFLDRRHDIQAQTVDLTSQVTISRAGDVYEGVASSPRLTVRIQDYVPIDLDLRGGFRYTPGVLALNSIGMRGRGIEAFLSGKIAPLSEGAYNFNLRSNVRLERVREIFRVARVLQGQIALDTNLRGKGGAFALTGAWASPKIGADVYDLTDAKGRLDVTGDRTIVDVTTAKYGGGTISAHYTLPVYSEPYPMRVDLRYNGVSLEKLFSDWDIRDTGLRGAATGRLAYGWNKDKILEGAGEGSATLAPTRTAFSNAKYPIPLGGDADFALDNGVVKFSRASLTTTASRVDFTGSLRIEDVYTDLALRIHSNDFSELDRLGFNFAKSAGKKKYELLGLGGAGDISGTVKGRLKTPDVVAHITGTQTRYNNALLGDSDIDLRYDGVKGVLTFDRAVFHEAGGVLTMTGTIGFPDRGPSPRFDLAVDARDFPVDETIKVVTIPLNGIHGTGTGKLIITGTPDEGRVTFVALTIAQPGSQLKLNGDVAWFPGTGTARFNLDIAAHDFPVRDIVTFLDLGTFPVTGQLTGTLHIEGTKKALEGAGSVTVRNGTIYGEPVTQATAEIAFSKGAVRATNVEVTSPAGKVTGEAELNLNTNQFSYTIQSGSVDLSKVGLLKSVAGLLGGNVTIVSSGAGTFNQPELVATLTLNQATIRGLALPAGTAPPQIYVAIRNGQLIVRGSIDDIVTIDGNGTVGANFAVTGLVKIIVNDVARLAALFPTASTLPISGRLEADLQLGGTFASLDTIRIDGSVPVFDIMLSDHEFTAARPIRFGLRGGRFTVDDFEVQHPGASFTITGGASLTGKKDLGLRLKGNIEAALAQLFVNGLRAEGHVDVDATLGGTVDKPNLAGSAEMEDAQFRFPGFPQIIDHVTGRVTFDSDAMRIALKAAVGGGEVSVGGNVTLDGLKATGLSLTLAGEDVSLRYFEGLTIAGNFDLRLTGTLDSMALRGDVTVNRALYFRDFDFGTALLNVVLSRRTITPIVGASWQDRVHLDLHVTSGPSVLAIRNNIADVTGTTMLDVAGTLANPTVIGNVTLDEGGRVRLQSIDYRVVSGSISFQNPFRIDPYFDITLEGRVSNVGYSEFDEGGPIDVTINLTGTIDRFTPTITSDPPASDITLFSLLGFGGLTGRTTTGVTQATSSSYANVGASIVAQSLLRTIPFASSFSYDPGLLETFEDPGPKVTFQRQVAANLRVLIIYNLRNSKSRSLVEWQVSPDWTVQITRDEVRNEYRAEARFRRRYEGHWTWGGHGRPVTFTASLGRLTSDTTVGQAPASATPVPQGTGPMVTRVAYRADAAFDTSLLTRYVSVAPGQPLSIRAVQNSIKSLFATGDFRDIRVETAPEGPGVAVTFVLSLNFRLAEIHFDGLAGSERDRAEHELTVHVGDVLSLNAVDRSATAIEQDLKDSGYLEAKVDPETQFERQRSRAVVTFHVTTGPHAKIANVTIEGNIAPFTPAMLIGQMHRGPGKTFSVRDARTDALNMRRYMIRREYRKADVRFAGETYDKATGSVNLRYTAESGPKVRVEVTGVPRRAVRSVLPFRRNQPYSEDVIDAAAEDITTLYQRRGYFNAAVDTSSRLEADNTWVTTFNVKPGQHFRLTAVNFIGNRKISGKKLLDAISIAPQSGFRAFFAGLFHRGGVTAQELTDDRDAIESLYRLNGFSDAAVATPVVKTDAQAGTMTVTFPITEGPQTIVRTVRVEGNEQAPTRKLPELQLKAGDPLNPQLLRTDIVNLQSFYADRGNAEVQITPRVDTSPDKTDANVTYVIAEGPLIHIGDVIVRGNTYTKSSVVLRETELKKGQPFSYSSLLEAQRNLYRLGIFQRAEVQPEQAGTAVDQRNVVVQIEEGKDLALSGSLGGIKQMQGTASALLGSASIANRNLFGTGRYLGLDLIGSYPSGQRQEAFLTYREPFIGRFNVPLQMTVFQSDQHLGSGAQGAHIRQHGLSIEATKITRFETRWSLRYEYRFGRCKIEEAGDLCDAASQALIPGVDRSITNIAIADITPTFFWDKRDDPIDPHRGFFTSASVEYAFPAFAANAQFFKEYAQASYYIPLSARSVFAVSTRFGFIQAVGSTASENCSETQSCIPLTERFTAGGESSHRAYGLDLLGDYCGNPAAAGCRPTLIMLNGSLAPIGGRALFLTNLEYRFPIFAGVGGALFTDIGNVFADSTLHLNELRYGAGAGLRYLSPVGPLRFDVGWKIHRRPYEKKPFAYFITLGYAF